MYLKPQNLFILPSHYANMERLSLIAYMIARCLRQKLTLTQNPKTKPFLKLRDCDLSWSPEEGEETRKRTKFLHLVAAITFPVSTAR